jgi:hypothetical protein
MKHLLWWSADLSAVMVRLAPAIRFIERGIAFLSEVTEASR